MKENRPIRLKENFWNNTDDMCPNCKVKAFRLPNIIETKVFWGLFSITKFEYTCKQCGHIWEE